MIILIYIKIYIYLFWKIILVDFVALLMQFKIILIDFRDYINLF